MAPAPAREWVVFFFFVGIFRMDLAVALPRAALVGRAFFLVAVFFWTTFLREAGRFFVAANALVVERFFETVRRVFLRTDDFFRERVVRLVAMM